MNGFGSRRAVLRGSIAAAFAAGARVAGAQPGAPVFSPPIGLPGQILGDGFFIRDGFACENTWYNPGWFHTAEDFYVPDGNAAGAGVYAIADGEIVYAGGAYPGLVVVVQHADDLSSMYGHLDEALAVWSGSVTRGQLLGTVLDQTGGITSGITPSHLHFEIRTFLVKDEINGAMPRYASGCTLQCPPGPGYWPIDAPEHPAAMGWRNPTHVIANRVYDGNPPAGAEVIVASGAAASAPLWSAPADRAGAARRGDLPLRAGDRYRLLAIETGEEASQETSAEGYRLWYRIEAPDAGSVWVQAALPTPYDTGSDGRPSSVRFDFLLPVVAA